MDICGRKKTRLVLVEISRMGYTVVIMQSVLYMYESEEKGLIGAGRESFE